MSEPENGVGHEDFRGMKIVSFSGGLRRIACFALCSSSFLWGNASLTVRTPPFPHSKILLPIRQLTATSGEPSTISGHFMGSQMTSLGSGVSALCSPRRWLQPQGESLAPRDDASSTWSLAIGINLVRFVASGVEDRRFKSVVNGVYGIVAR